MYSKPAEWLFNIHTKITVRHILDEEETSCFQIPGESTDGTASAQYGRILA